MVEDISIFDTWDLIVFVLDAINQRSDDGLTIGARMIVSVICSRGTNEREELRASGVDVTQLINVSRFNDFDHFVTQQ